MAQSIEFGVGVLILAALAFGIIAFGVMVIARWAVGKSP